MATTLPPEADCFFNIEPDREHDPQSLPPLPPNLQLSAYLVDLNAVQSEIDKYADCNDNDTNIEQSQPKPNAEHILDQPIKGIPSIMKARQKTKQQKQAQKQRFIDNNPMKKLSKQALCPWKQLDVRDNIKSYVSALLLSLLYTTCFVFPPFTIYCVLPTHSKETQ